MRLLNHSSIVSFQSLAVTDAGMLPLRGLRFINGDLKFRTFGVI